MTEEEARNKWCPMARVQHVTFPRPNDEGTGLLCVGNRDIGLLVTPNDFDAETDITKCIASDCMAWRWIDPTNPHLDDRAAEGGYCGLAGKP